MPRCAILYVGQVTVSTPFTMIDPVRRPTSPRIDLSVEVRPAPLRPRSVTTSPLWTVRSTPCSTCDSPYQAWTPETRRTSSAMSRPHVRFHHLRVGRDLGVRTLREDGAALQHRDAVANPRDDAHVVLDHEHGAPNGDFLDEVLYPVDVLVPHAGLRLVEEHQLGLHR